MEYCTQCKNNCPVDALQCGRGRRAFGLEQGEHGHGHEGHGVHGHHQPLEGTLGLLQRCGRALYHGKLGADALSTLTVDEQAQLDALLSKLLESWDQ